MKRSSAVEESRPAIRHRRAYSPNQPDSASNAHVSAMSPPLCCRYSQFSLMQLSCSSNGRVIYAHDEPSSGVQRWWGVRGVMAEAGSGLGLGYWSQRRYFFLPPFFNIYFVFNNTHGNGDIRGERRDWQTTGD